MMKICINCGVELDDGLTVCPLCGRNTENNSEQEHIPQNAPSEIIRLHRKENRRHLWELSGIITFSGIAVCTIVDLIASKGWSWSLFSDVSILAAWIILTLFLYAYKRTLIIIPVLMVTILGALLAYDLITPGAKWFLPVGLPLTISAFAAAGILVVLYRAANFKGFNIIAVALIVFSGFCILIEIILDKYLNGIVYLHWSLIVAVSALPVALIFFFYHYRLKKGNQLNSFFHI
jgi:peptidoglycan/LPS O-acetylase OafA/YrhL